MSATENATQQEITTLYSDHHGWLQGWLRKKLGNTFDAADLAHDTFVRVLGKSSDLGGLREPRAWLTSIAQGLVIDHVRRQEVERAYYEVLARLPEQEMFSPEMRLTILETLWSIDALLDGLNPKVRSAFLMSRLEDMTYPEIAVRLAVSLSSVEKYMALAVRHCYEIRRAHRALS